MSDPALIALFVAVPATLSAVFSGITSIMVARAKDVVEKLEKNTNSIKDELVRVTGESEHAKGKLEGASEEKDRQ